MLRDGWRSASSARRGARERDAEAVGRADADGARERRITTGEPGLAQEELAPTRSSTAQFTAGIGELASGGAADEQLRAQIGSRARSSAG